MFVNINTSNGALQFAAYNEHNGYYGHEAVVISEKSDLDAKRLPGVTGFKFLTPITAPQHRCLSSLYYFPH